MTCPRCRWEVDRLRSGLCADCAQDQRGINRASRRDVAQVAKAAAALGFWELFGFACFLAAVLGAALLGLM